MRMSQEPNGTRQAYPDFDGEDHAIGLRAVAAAVRYQGDINNNTEHPPKKTAPPPATASVLDNET
jgi:hypothetical protein